MSDELANLFYSEEREEEKEQARVDALSGLEKSGEMEQLERLLEHLLKHHVMPHYKAKGHGRESYITTMSVYLQAKAMKLQLDVLEQQERHAEGLNRATNRLAFATVVLVIATLLNFIALICTAGR